MAGSRPVQARASKIASSRSRRNTMRQTLRLFALASGAIRPPSIRTEHKARTAAASALGARQASTRASKPRRGLPPRLEEDVRLIGALAELFAAAAAERLMDTDAAMDATRPTLPLIALATGVALCAPLLQQQTSPRPGRGNDSRRDAASGGRRRARRLCPSPRGQASLRVLRDTDAIPMGPASGSHSIPRPSAS
jgi:hypothetical protein